MKICHLLLVLCSNPYDFTTFFLDFFFFKNIECSDCYLIDFHFVLFFNHEHIKEWTS